MGFLRKFNKPFPLHKILYSDIYYTTKPRDGPLSTDEGYYHPSIVQFLEEELQVYGFIQNMNFYPEKPPNGRQTDWIVQELEFTPAYSERVNLMMG